MKKLKTMSLACLVCIPFLIGHEALVTEPYIDMVGKKTWCVGETVGEAKESYTVQECLDLLYSRIEDYEAPLKKCIVDWAHLPPKTQASLISWAYNVGTSNACSSNAVTGKFNKGKWKEACEGLMLWNKGGRPLKEIKGLTNRRTDERKMCLEQLNGA